MKKTNFSKVLPNGIHNKGLSMIELIVALAIIGILSVSIVQSMASSSKTYYRSSAEAQLQSEAQLVANSISEIAVDCYDATDKMTAGVKSELGIDDTVYDTSDGKVLVLYGKSVDGSGTITQSQYAIARKTGTDELYLFEKITTGAAVETSSAVLANYIQDFNIPDIDRVKNENMLSFELTYERQDSTNKSVDKRKYKGNYQVLMRNRQYAGKAYNPSNTPEIPNLKLTLTPKIVYLDVKGSTSDIGKDYITGYHNNTVNEGAALSVSGAPGDVLSAGVELHGEVSPSAYNTSISWKLMNVDDAYFFFKNAEGNYVKAGDLDPVLKLYWEADKDMSNLTVDSFDVIASKEIDYTISENSTQKITASPKKTTFKIRRVKSLGLRPTSGMTKWKNIFTTEYGGKQSPEAVYYAEPEGSGLKDMMIQSTAVAPYIENGGTVQWKLSIKKDDGSAWQEITSEEDKKLYARLTPVTYYGNGGIATISFGTAAANGQLYKIETQSDWDPTRKAELIIGVAPTGGGDSSGFFSRGYYIDLLSWVQSNEKYESITKLLDAQLGSAGGSSEYAGYKLVKKDGRYYLLYDYNAAYYSGEQRINFYKEVQTLEIKITNQSGQNGNDGLGIQGSTGSNLQYKTLPVYVHRIPNYAVTDAKPIVIKKGASVALRVQTEYYNVHDRSMFGVYIGNKGNTDAMETNLNKSGLNESNQYLAFSIDDSQYGGLYSYNDTIMTDLTAKAATKAYNPNPMTVRMTADDFYLLSKYGKDSNNADGSPIKVADVDVDGGNGVKNVAAYMSSYVDYTVYIANVEGQDAFVSCPGTGSSDTNLDWDTKFKSAVEGANEKSKAVDINGYNADGDLVTGIAKAYKNGNKYKLIYKGTEYTYNQTYKYWAK